MNILTIEQLIEYCEDFKWTRKASEIHVHHTWKPNHSDFTGSNHQQLQTGMKNYHVKTLGWSDIGQHLTLFPDGTFMLGRDFNRNPASISGRNSLGFAIEMVGNFEQEKLEGKQLESMMIFCNYMIDRFGLDVTFHNEYSSKSCPAVDKNWFMDELANNRIDTQLQVKQDNPAKQSNLAKLNWKHVEVKKAIESGILNSSEWYNKVDESAPVWMVLTLINRLNQDK